MPFEDFTGSPWPGTLDEYLDYRQHAIEFIELRNRRIAAYVAEHPTKPRPPWDLPRFEAVLAQGGNNLTGATSALASLL